MIDGGQTVGLTETVGNEGGIVDALGEVAFVAGEQQHMVEVEVTGLENAHDLYAFDGFAVEGYRG